MNAVLRLMNCAVLHATLHRGLYSDPFLNKDIEVNIRGWIMVVAQMSRSEKSVIGSQTHHHFIEVDFMGIEFRTVNADKFGLAVNSHSAGATHTCAVNHNGVE